MRTTMHISLPENLKTWVEGQIEAGDFGTASEYIRQLLREEQKRQARLAVERKLEEALDSGPAVPVTDADWEARKRRIVERADPSAPGPEVPNYLENPVAARELEALTEHIAERNVRAALRFVDAVRAAYAKLARLPELGGEWQSPNPRVRGIRCWPLPRFKNYVIFYRSADDGVEILHITQGSRDLEALLAADNG